MKKTKRTLTLLLTAAIIFSVCASCGDNTDDAPPSISPTVTPSESPTPATPEVVSPTPSEKPSPSPASTPTPTPTPPPAPPYDYSQPVAESDPVTDEYFSDSLFIGDSRTQGLMMYSGIPEAASLTGVGLNVKSIYTANEAYVNGTKMPIMSALEYYDVSNVYIMLGVNELGWHKLEAFKDDYRVVLEDLREAFPDANIYVQSVIPVTQTKSDYDPIYNNPRIEQFNTYIRELAVELELYYLNVQEALVNENGALPEEASWDGVHMNPDHYKLWLEYIRCHVVQED